MHDADECNGRDDVMRGGNDRGEAEPPLEPDGQIDQGHDEAQQNGHQRLALQLASDLGPDRFMAQDRVLPHTDAAVECAPDRCGHGVRFLRRGRRRRDARANHVRSVRAECLDVGTLEAPVVERRPDIRGGHLLVQLHLHQGAARELDAVVEAARHQEDEADEHDGAGE